MKTFMVEMDVTFSVRMYEVEAESEEQAKAMAVEAMDKDPRYYTRWGAHVNTEVTDVFEEKED